MLKRLHFILVVTLMSTFISTSLACAEITAWPGSKAVAAGTGECTITKTASLSISFNSIESDISNIESHFGGKKRKIQELGQQADISKISLSSMSYSVSPSSGFQYNVSGSMSFSVTPVERATAFLTLLAKNGFNPSLSVSAYPSGGAGTCDFNSLIKD